MNDSFMTNNKNGLSFYAIDTDRYQDKRIKRLKKNFGCKGIAVYDYILCEIYRVQGCFIEWDGDTAFDVAEYFGLSEELVKEIVKYCGSVGLYNKELLTRGIITSASIQRRWLDMSQRARRKNPTIPTICQLVENTPPPANEEPLKPQHEVYCMTLEEEISLMKTDEIWLDQLQVLHHIDSSVLINRLDDFKAQCLADGKENGHNSIADAKQHFNNWLRKTKRNYDTPKPDRHNQRRSNVLAPNAEKTYGNSF
jgi:hypothetical protein